ncbi:NUDIX hydrolase [Pedobacter alpinus]|uniref:NUDIX hydrolase n=1 Tax=Pedobacter alpinus TaxID=1590643 RepID=A0ABW5TWT8_9SPHI
MTNNKNFNIYINEKSLIITDAIPADANNYQLIDANGFEFDRFYNALAQNPISLFYITTDDAKSVFKLIKKNIRIIEAAGGLVKNEKGKYLFIKRLGKWDLPKGKLELNEKKKDAAVREVEEECGIKIKKLGNKLLKTYHVYEIKGKMVLKISHWYAMEAKANQKLIPQTEEGITEVKWFAKNDFNIIRSNTYANILDVVNF